MNRKKKRVVDVYRVKIGVSPVKNFFLLINVVLFFLFFKKKEKMMMMMMLQKTKNERQL